MKKTVCFIGATVLLVLTTAFCVAGTVQSQGNDSVVICESFYQQLEEEYVDELREYLNGAGFVNSGIMLTRTVYENGEREYQVVVHNSRFGRLTDEEIVILENVLAEKSFQAEGCSFTCLLKGNA